MKRIEHYIKEQSCKAGEYTVTLVYVGHTFPTEPWGSETHCHENWEIHYITGGRGILKTDQSEYVITDGSMFITGPGIIHAQIADPDNPMEEYCIRFRLGGGQKQKRRDSEISDVLRSIDDHRFIFTEFDFDCRYPISEIIAELENMGTASQERMYCLFLSLLISTSRCISNAVSVEPAAEKHPDRNEILERYMRTYSGDINVGELSEKLHISQRHLRRIMHDSYDSTMTQQKNKLRIESARRLLLETDLTVSEIAEQTGFSSPSYFSRCFKKICGMPPVEYRKHTAKDG